METSSPEVVKGTYQLIDNNYESSLEVEVKIKVQAEELYFIKVQNSLDDD